MFNLPLKCNFDEHVNRLHSGLFTLCCSAKGGKQKGKMKGGKVQKKR